MTRRFVLVTLALAVVAQAGPRRPPKAPRVRAPPAKAPPAKKLVKSAGEVTWVGVEFAYVDRGSAEGVEVGKPLILSRGGRAAGTCTVQSVAEHSARCTGLTLRVGDRFTVSAAPAPPPEGPKPLPTELELRRRGALVESTPWVLRRFDSPALTLGAGLHASAALSHTTFFTAASPRPAFGQQRVDVVVSDLELWKGLRVSADLSVLNFSSRPEVTRTVYTQTPVLLVRQLELGFRRADLPLAAGLGRTWLTTGPGLLVLDGAHTSFRIGAAEVGVFAGLLPDGARLTPSLSQWSTGAFTRLSFTSGEGASAAVLQVAGRAGYALRDGIGSRFEAAVGAGYWAGSAFDAHASVEVGYGSTQAAAGIDAARLDLGWRPTERLLLLASGRYRGLPIAGVPEVGLVSPGLSALHGDLAATWQLTPALVVGLRGGVARDFTSTLTQLRAGPELSMPGLFGGPVSLGLGYAEEVGWLRGRSGWFNLSVTAGSFFRVLSRTSFFHQQPTAGAEGLFAAELGQSLSLEVTPWRFVRARLVLVGRQTAGEAFAPMGSVGGQVAGTF
ncbi:MAG: hypothetical protein JNJ54_24330 [Myxococcaceae bacterium]|nr:hypothetical protein [Myxococcaceae bacterium]